MKIGNNSLKFNNVYLETSATIVGPMEGKGPLKDYYDKIYDSLYCGKKCWESAEKHILHETINTVINKSKITSSEVDFIISGDLINQNIISNYVMRNFNIPHFGVYSACATSMESLTIGAIMIESKAANNIVTAVSSHNSTAERQYRYPTEYGVKKPLTSTYTVTGSGSSLITNRPSDIKITKATVGKVVDAGVKDPLDMGSAMAPAASNTIKQHFIDFNISPNEYDMILTGDLSKIGSRIVREILKKQNYDLYSNHNDCGLMVYDINKQPVFAGGSGCACSAVVTYSYVINQLMSKKIKKVLIVATGALLNPIMIQQKESIPSIAHAVVLERVMK